MKNGPIIILLVLVIPVCAHADLAPMAYSAFSFTPVYNSTIRMARETVDIYVGDRYSDDTHIRRVRVAARFYMHNDGEGSIVVDVGFPISAEFFDMDTTKTVIERIAKPAEKNRKYGIYEFTVSVDGTAQFRPEPAIVLGTFSSRIPHPHMWYGWTTVFPPGVTIVDVEYHVKTNHGYGSMDQHTTYILGTGRLWKDDIGEAVVRVHLPEDEGEVWVSTAHPLDHDRTGNTLSWKLDNFEPDLLATVAVGFMPPEITEDIRSLERLERKHPNDAEVLLDLAKAYLYAAPRGRPARSNETDFAMLAEINLEKTLAIDSLECEAWRLYAKNYYRMYENSFGPGFWHRFEIRGRHREIVELACRKCPDDEEIGLWYTLLEEDRWEPPQEVGYEIVTYGGQQFIKLNDFQRDLGPVLRPHEVRALDKYYKRSKSSGGVTYFELKSKKLSRSDKDQIVKILERRSYFQERHKRETMWEIYKRS